MKIINYFSLFAVIGLVSPLGCSASSDESQSTDEAVSATYSCKVDSDCTAISKGGCCPNGWKVAVNKSHVASYEASHECSDPQICPLYVIDDTRVAECNTAKGKCALVAPEDIKCGGFTTNPHKCPKGYLCEANHIPDVPGDCVAK